METYLASDKIWVTKYIYADAEENYYIYLTKISNQSHVKMERQKNEDRIFRPSYGKEEHAHKKLPEHIFEDRTGKSRETLTDNFAEYQNILPDNMGIEGESGCISHSDDIETAASNSSEVKVNTNEYIEQEKEKAKSSKVDRVETNEEYVDQQAIGVNTNEDIEQEKAKLLKEDVIESNEPTDDNIERNADHENKTANKNMNLMPQNQEVINKFAIDSNPQIGSFPNPDNWVDVALEFIPSQDRKIKYLNQENSSIWGEVLQETPGNKNKDMTESSVEKLETDSGDSIYQQPESISNRSNIEWSAPELNPLKEYDNAEQSGDRTEMKNAGDVINSKERNASGSYKKNHSSGIEPLPKGPSGGNKHSQRYPKKSYVRKDPNECQKHPLQPSTSRSYIGTQHPENGSSEGKDRRQRRNVPRNERGNYRQNEKHAESTNGQVSNGSKDYNSHNYSPTQWRNTQRRGRPDVEKLNTEVMNLKKALANQEQEMKQMLTNEFEKKLKVQEGMWQKLVTLQQSQDQNKNVNQQHPPPRRNYYNHNRNRAEMETLRNNLHQLEEDCFSMKNEIRLDLVEELKHIRAEQNLLIETRLQRHEDGINNLIDAKIRAFELEYMNGPQYNRY